MSADGEQVPVQEEAQILLLEGEVLKLGGKFRNKWQKRHLKLYNTVLLYGKEKNGVFNINGEIPVDSIGACIQKDSGMGKKNAGLGFELKVIDEEKNVRTYQFGVEDADKCNEWVVIIKECINSTAQKKRQLKKANEAKTQARTASTSEHVTSPKIEKTDEDSDEKTSTPINRKVTKEEQDEEQDEEEREEGHVDSKTEDISDTEEDEASDTKSSTDGSHTTDIRSLWSRTDISTTTNAANEPQKAEVDRMKLISSIFQVKSDEKMQQDLVRTEERERVYLAREHLKNTMSEFLNIVIEEDQKKRLEQEASAAEKGLGDLQKLDYCNAEICFKDTLGRDAKSVYYSQYVQWHNPLHKNRPERALLVLTRSLLYLAEPNTFTALDAVKIMDIRHIVQSGYEHDVITIVPEQHVLEYNNDGLDLYDIMIRFEQGKADKAQDTTPESLTPYDRKIEFFDQITGIYSRLKIHFVDEVEPYTRMGPGTKKEQQQQAQLAAHNQLIKQQIIDVTSPIDPYDIIRIDEKKDLAIVRKQIELCKLLSNFGDKEILFSGVVTKITYVLAKKKRSERLFIVSDLALYIFKKNKLNMFQRRLPLEEISKLVIPSDSGKHLLVRAPAEYDLYIVSDQTDTICSVIKNLFEEADRDSLVDKVSDTKDRFDRHAILSKTDDYRKKMQALEQYDAVMNLLRSALTQKQPDKLKVYLEYANRCRPDPNMESNKYKSFQNIKQLAESTLKEIKIQDLIQEKLQAAIDTEDIAEINKWYNKVLSLTKLFDSLKYYRDKVAIPKINEIQNKKIVLQRMKTLIDRRIKSLSKVLEGDKEEVSERELFDAFDYALRAGFIEEVEHNKLLYNRELHKLHLRQRLREVEEGHDADSLVLILEEAKQLGIYDYLEPVQETKQTESIRLLPRTEFQEQEKHMRKYIEHKLVINQIKSAIDRAKSANDHTSLNNELTEMVKQFPWVSSNEVYQYASSVVVKELESFEIDIKKLAACLKKVDAAVQKSEITDSDVKQLTKYIENVKCKIGTSTSQKQEHIDANRKGDKRMQLTDADARLLQKAQQTLFHVQELIKNKLQKKSRTHRQKLQTALSERNWTELEVLLTSKSLDSYMSVNKQLEQLVKEANHIIDVRSNLSKMTQDNNQYSYKDIDKIKSIIEDAERFGLYEDTKQEQALTELLNNIQEEADAYQNLRDAIDTNDQRFVDLCIEAADRFPNLREAVLQAKQEMQQKREQENVIAGHLRRAIKSNHVSNIRKQILAAKGYPSLLPTVEKAKRILDELVGGVDGAQSMESQVRRLSNDPDGLAEFILKNEDFMPLKVLKMAKSELNRLRGFVASADDVIQVLQASMDNDNKQELKRAIETAQQFLRNQQIQSGDVFAVKNLLKEAQKKLGKIEYQENIGLVKDLRIQFGKISDEDDTVFDLSNSSYIVNQNGDSTQTPTDVITTPKPKPKERPTHPLLEKLRLHVNKLRSVCSNINTVDEDMGKYVVDMHNPFGQNVVRVLTDVLAEGLKGGGLLQGWISNSKKTPWDVFIGLQDETMRNYVQTFQSEDYIDSLIKENNGFNLSILFIHYLLSVDFFMYAVEQLLSNDAYLAEYYDPTSLLRDVRYRDDLYPIMSLLNMFHFQFHIQTKADVLIASPISKLKGVVRSIVQYFVSNRNEAKSQLTLCGDENWKSDIGILVRGKLCDAILNILNHRFKSSGFFVKYHIWQLFEESAQQKRISAIDIGGIGLPDAVDTVNRLFEQNKQLVGNNSQFVNDAKFVCFVCLALNDNYLHEYLESIYRDTMLISKYYEPNSGALMMDPTIRDKMCDFLSVLSQLSFKLNWETIYERH